MVLDFVKHSSRSPAEIHVIQSIIESILTDAVNSLNLTQYLFTHTGDGWMCILLGDDSARAMDFVNLSFIALRQRLESYNQTFRAGLDYGLLHLRQSAVGQAPSHFDVPGIQSARLESAAKPQQVLCTETVRAIFAPHYAEMFLTEPVEVQTKDRTMRACEVTPLPLPNVRIVVSDLFFASPDRLGRNLQGTKKLLFVDDEPSTLEFLPHAVREYVDEARLVTAHDGAAALDLFRPGEFMAVVTDVMMPHMSGTELANRIAAIDPAVPVILISGYYNPLEAEDDSVFDSCVVLAIQKPFYVHSLLRALYFASAFGTPTNLRGRLRLVTDDPRGFLRRIEWIADAVHHIVRRVNVAEDVGHSLLRHKAKRIADDVIRRIVPGGDVTQFLEIGATQLRTLQRMSYVVTPSRVLSLEEHLRNMAEDYGTANKKAKVMLSCSLVDAPALTAVQSVALLVAAELVDNAMDAVERKGLVSIDCRWERTNQQLCIEVTDDGPGVPDHGVSNLFRSGRSTRGPGRGLGLGLINQACEAFKGTARYVREDGRTTFIATLRLPEIRKQETKGDVP